MDALLASIVVCSLSVDHRGLVDSFLAALKRNTPRFDGKRARGPHSEHLTVYIAHKGCALRSPHETEFFPAFQSSLAIFKTASTMRSAALFLLACFVLQTAAAARHPGGARALQQWGWGGSTRANQQIAAAQVSRVSTQQAIRSAVNNPFPEQQFAATRTATGVGQVGTTLTAVNPCALAWTWNCWGGGGFYSPWGRR